MPYGFSASVFWIERVNYKYLNLKYDESIDQMNLTDFEDQVTSVMH